MAKTKIKAITTTQFRISIKDAPSVAHRTGIGGLALVLDSIKRSPEDPLLWNISSDEIFLEWDSSVSDLEVLQWLCDQAYKIDQYGLIEIPQLMAATHGIRANIHNIIMGSVLSHPLSKSRVERDWTQEEKESGKRSTKISKFRFEEMSFPFSDEDSEEIIYKFFPVNSYGFQGLPAIATNKKGAFKKTIDIKSWLLPGASQRHQMIGATKYCESPKGFLQLMFLPAGCDYFQVRSRIIQDKARFAVVLPSVQNITEFVRLKKLYRFDPMETQVTSGAFDAAFLSLSQFIEEELSSVRAVDGCEIVIYGDRPWNTKFKIITARQFVPFDSQKMYRLNLARILKPGIKQGKNGNFISVFFGREIVTENILRGFCFYAGLSDIIRESTDYIKQLSMEGKQLRLIYEEAVRMPDEVPYYAQKWADGFNYLLFCLYGSTKATTPGGQKANYKRIRERLQMDLRFIETHELFQDWLQKLRSNVAFTSNPFWSEINDSEFNLVEFEYWLSENWKQACNLATLMILGYSNPWKNNRMRSLLESWGKIPPDYIEDVEDVEEETDEDESEPLGITEFSDDFELELEN